MIQRTAAPAPAPGGAPGAPAPGPVQVPPQRYTTRPKGWPEKTWNFYNKICKQFGEMRKGPGGVVANVGGMFLGPDNCFLKIPFAFYRMDGEDDYPYIPRGCGGIFDFALEMASSNGLRVPWMVVVGALYIVTGMHSPH